MMKTLYKFILLQLVSPVALAGSFFQVINLHITPTKYINRASVICLVTTDFLEPHHCGYYPSEYYYFGPKNWKLIYDKKFVKIDNTCKMYVDRTQRTPDESGQLDIYGTLDKEAYRENYTLKNCSTQWKAQVS